MTTLWEVAESQQNINAWVQDLAGQQVIQQAPQQVVVQPTQTVEQTNLTWTSSWVEQTQIVQPVQQQVQVGQPATPSTPSPEDLLKQIQWVVEESKTLEEVAKEDDASRIQKENEAVLKSLVEENVSDLPNTTPIKEDVQAQISDTSESDKLAQDIKESIEDMKTVQQAKDAGCWAQKYSAHGRNPSIRVWRMVPLLDAHQNRIWPSRHAARSHAP